LHNCTVYIETSLSILLVYSKDYVFLNGQTEIVNRNTGESIETGRLCTITDPEVKRKIIGDMFMKVVRDFDYFVYKMSKIIIIYIFTI